MVRCNVVKSRDGVAADRSFVACLLRTHPGDDGCSLEWNRYHSGRSSRDSRDLLRNDGADQCSTNQQLDEKLRCSSWEACDRTHIRPLFQVRRPHPPSETFSQYCLHLPTHFSCNAAVAESLSGAANALKYCSL